ncbi:hypothetical protein [Streptomyces iconiensis]|uniref:4-amino-4-deoxy-L-arabinose transferase n=1 Tax=Streptomyces iconiensis TaxID=1384038 RepID=A0ABT6ZY81_9ACTN|nr:hypothetical protein [Streptomyces iconiensis]MDJ1134016.1 hypothetical protein [Streptomyces iconiensis]
MSGMSLYGVQQAGLRPAPGPSGVRALRAVRGDRDHLWLIAVCALFGALSLALVPPWLPLGWDEIVYASRFAPYGPETPFSAPRTRGVPVLIAPVAAVSDSVVLLRCYLAALASCALYLGYRPWLRSRRPARAAGCGALAPGGGSVPGGGGGVLPGGRATAAPAAALYASVWFALFYAGSAMPNHYVAMGCAAAVGCFLRIALAEADRPVLRPAAVLAAALACATLMRPHDTLWPALVLALATLCPRGWPGPWCARRRGAAAVAVAAGPVLGLVPWVVESALRFGGVAERLRLASAVQGGIRPAFSLPEHAAALDGPLLCRPCGAAPVDAVSVAWWLLIPPLVALGVRAARARERTALAVLPLLAAVAVAAPYLFLLDYAAPRFLLPAYALLAPVAALGVSTLVRDAPRARLRWLVPVSFALASAHLGVQLHQLTIHARVQAGARGDWHRMHGFLAAHGVRPPCVLDGDGSVVPVAHTAGCRPRAHPGRDAAATASAAAAGGTAAATGTPDALVLHGRTLPAWARAAGWRAYPVTGAYDPRWHVALPPDRDRDGEEQGGAGRFSGSRPG